MSSKKEKNPAKAKQKLKLKRRKALLPKTKKQQYRKLPFLVSLLLILSLSACASHNSQPPQSQNLAKVLCQKVKKYPPQTAESLSQMINQNPKNPVIKAMIDYENLRCAVLAACFKTCEGNEI